MPVFRGDPWTTAFLGAYPCRIILNSWVRRPSIYQGGRERMRAGNVISTEHTPMRVWDMVWVWLTEEERTEHLTQAPKGTAIFWTFGNNESGYFLIDFGDQELVEYKLPDGSAGIYIRVKVHMEETVP